jgi:uncharacterized protein YfaT (DUF1175 family)
VPAPRARGNAGFPEGKNVQRVVAKFDREARELPADVLAILTPAEVEEWREWRVKEDEEELKQRPSSSWTRWPKHAGARMGGQGLCHHHTKTTPSPSARKFGRSCAC